MFWISGKGICIATPAGAAPGVPAGRAAPCCPCCCMIVTACRERCAVRAATGLSAAKQAGCKQAARRGATAAAGHSGGRPTATTTGAEGAALPCGARFQILPRYSLPGPFVSSCRSCALSSGCGDATEANTIKTAPRCCWCSSATAVIADCSFEAWLGGRPLGRSTDRCLCSWRYSASKESSGRWTAGLPPRWD